MTPAAADYLQVLSPYLDLEAFVRHVAVEAFLAEIDGVLGDWGMNNFYLYRFERTTRSTLVPWDKSEAFKAGVRQASGATSTTCRPIARTC